jgi:hypothetical protein
MAAANKEVSKTQIIVAISCFWINVRNCLIVRYEDIIMPSFEVAHIQEQGQNMIIVPLDSDFEWQTPLVHGDTVRELELRSRAAGLAGRVVLVWEGGNGRMKFIAPQNWHPFFRSLSLAFVFRNLNKTLSW